MRQYLCGVIGEEPRGTAEVLPSGERMRPRSAGTRLIMGGGLAGVATTGVLAVLLSRSQDQPTAVLLTLAYAAPYVFALTLIRVRDQAARGGLLLALGLASLYRQSVIFSGRRIGPPASNGHDPCRVGPKHQCCRPPIPPDDFFLPRWPSRAGRSGCQRLCPDPIA